jgi:hypothetical protein
MVFGALGALNIRMATPLVAAGNVAVVRLHAEHYLAGEGRP